MRTFYIFKLQNNFIKTSKKDPYKIFVILYSIYTYKKKSILVAYDTFKEICIPINKDFFNKYYYDRLSKYEEYTKFKDTHMYHNYFTGEESKMTINYSNIKIKSNNENNIFIQNIPENLFICDFKNTYFFNTDDFKKIKVK